MKKLLLSVLLVSFGVAANAQKGKCFADEAKHAYMHTDKNYENIYASTEKQVAKWLENNKSQLKTTGSVVATIPVVFHVVYKNATQNIADSNLFRQINVLNECYRRTNANYSQTRPIFDTVSADVQIEFCLAQLDPNGDSTNGITRTQAPSNAAFDPIFNMDKVKSSATNGVDPWPTDQYLNIWVCDMSLFGVPFVLGYATFPGSDPSLDGVVIQYNFIGHQANGTTNDKGRTTVHEVGHWLGMRHIWGDGQQSSALCDSTDYVDDTPNADTASQQTCMIKNSCSNESPYWTNAGVDPPDMIENYMDYSYDACMTMFTQGQKNRMLGFLNTIRSTLLTSPGGCNPIGLNEHSITGIKIGVYPNPAHNQLNFKLASGDNFEVKIYDALGKLHLSSYLSSLNNDLSIENLEEGIFIYEIHKGSELIQAGKFIKE